MIGVENLTAHATRVRQRGVFNTVKLISNEFSILAIVELIFFELLAFITFFVSTSQLSI